MGNLLSKLRDIQATINVAKNQKNTFGNYTYRSCEDILQALQPYTQKLDIVVLLTDEIKETMNGWVYVEATATIKDVETGEAISVKAQAGIQERKGMDLSQTFGASSSYARKYALNGLFKLDDNKDADTNAFNKLINAENNDFKGKDNKIVEPKTKTPKNAENEKIKETTKAFMDAHIKDTNDLELPFEMNEEKQIENLTELHDTIARLNFQQNRDINKCYEYFCKMFNVKTAEDLNKDQLETIIKRLEKAGNKVMQ